MATKDCIHFIESQKIKGITLGLKWKRVSKSKDNEKNEIRVFQNSKLDTVTVKQDCNTGTLSIIAFALEPNTDVLNVLFEEKTDIQKIFIDNVDLLAEITFNAEYLLSDDLSQEDVLKYQTDEFKAITTDKLKQDYLLKLSEYKHKEKLNMLCYDFFHYLAIQQRKQPNRNSDISKKLNVLFNFENLEIQVKHLPADTNKNFDIIVGYASGDWEVNLNFTVFWDNKQNCPCMYVPDEEFNLYSRKHMTAYGSENENILGLEVTAEDEEKRERMMDNETYKASTKETLISLQKYLINKLSNPT